MNKFKIIKNNGLSYFWIKSLKGQQLNMNEVELLKNNDFNGLIPVLLKQKGSTFKLGFNVTGYINLATYLKNTVNKKEFTSLLNNILSTLKNMQNIYFNYKNVLLSDFKNIMVNPSTRSIYFIYAPIQYFDNEISLKDFFLKIVYNSIFSQEEDTSYVKEYINILQKHLNFSTFELEEYIKRMTVSIVNNNLAEGINEEKEIESNKNNIYDPLTKSGLVEDEKKEPVAEISNIENITSTQDFSEYTTILGNGEIIGTTRLGADQEDEQNFPYIIREKAQERIEINKPSFRIGKERSYCDCFISDNNAISRSHADIITREGRYYIVDDNSTNKTYVDNRVIPILKEVEIFSGTKFRLANEEFIFYID